MLKMFQKFYLIINFDVKNIAAFNQLFQIIYLN